MKLLIQPYTDDLKPIGAPIIVEVRQRATRIDKGTKRKRRRTVRKEQGK